MGTQYLNTQIRLKRGTAEAWARNNPILAKGEPGWATDTKVLKIGDGETHWNDLTYVVNVSDYVTEQELRDAIGKYDQQLGVTIEEIVYEIALCFDQVYEDINTLDADIQTKFQDIETAIDDIDSMASSHEVVLKNSVQPTLEQHSDTLDRLAGSISYNNCLKNYDPNLIIMEYTNRAGIWKASIESEATKEEIPGTSLFTDFRVDDWQEHSIDFTNDSTTNATFQIYSASAQPGVVEIDDVKIVQTGGYFTQPNIQCSPNSFYDGGDFWDWAYRPIAYPNDKGQMIINATETGWRGYVSKTLEVEPGIVYFVDIDIESITSGGVNFKITDADKKNISLFKEDNSTCDYRYFSKAEQVRYYFVSPTRQIQISFSSSGNYIDKAVVNHCILYRTNSVACKTTSPVMDSFWTNGENWYNWGKEVEYEGRKTVHFSTSEEKTYYYHKKRKLMLEVNTPYRLSFNAKCVSGGMTVIVKDNNGKTIVSQGISTTNDFDWARFQLSFTPNTSICTLMFQAWGDQTLLYDIYIHDLLLAPIVFGENYLNNGDFSVDTLINGGEIRPGRANWTLGSGSVIENGMARLAVPDGNTLTHVAGCSQKIALIPNATYRISFKSRSVSYVSMWKPYITFTNEDKKAFVADWKEPKYEALVFGGPWVKDSADYHAARVTIKGSLPMNAKYLCVDAGIWGSEIFEVGVKIKQDGELVYSSRHELDSRYGDPGNYSKFYLPLPENFVFSGDKSIELTFMVNEVKNSKYLNQIRSVNILGSFAIASHHSNPKYYVRPDGRMVTPTLITDRVITNIDDGSLDWEV